MRILIAFIGHMRSFPKTQRDISENLISPLGADVALFTRATNGFAPQDGVSKFHKSNDSVAMFRDSFSPVLVESLPSRRLPCGFINARADVRRWADERDAGLGLIGMGWRRSSVQSVLGMFELMSHASKRISSIASKYDVIIRARPDLEFKSPIDPQPIHGLRAGGKKILHPPFCNVLCNGGMNDQFFAGRPDDMIPLMGISTNIPLYAKQNISIQPEVMLGHHLRQLGLHSEPMPVDYIIRRASGKKIDQRGARD